MGSSGLIPHEGWRGIWLWRPASRPATALPVAPMLDTLNTSDDAASLGSQTHAEIAEFLVLDFSNHEGAENSAQTQADTGFRVAPPEAFQSPKIVSVCSKQIDPPTSNSNPNPNPASPSDTDTPTSNHLSTSDTPSDPSISLSEFITPAEAQVVAATTSRSLRTFTNGRATLSEQHALDLLNAALFAASPAVKRPLNTFVSVLYRDHDKLFNQAGVHVEKARKAIKEAIVGLLQTLGIPPTYLYVEENPAGGGPGLHLHMLAHLPEQDFQANVERLTNLLAKSFKGKLTALCRQHRIRTKTRTTPGVMYAALLPGKQDADRRRVEASNAYLTRKANADPAKVEQLERAIETSKLDVELHSLPFHVGYQEGKAGRPLDQHYVLTRTLPYIMKSIDPSIVTVDRWGTTTSLAEMDRHHTPNGDVHLQPQSLAKRPPRPSNIAQSINATAQAKAGWTPTAWPIAATLSASVRTAVIMQEITRAMALGNLPPIRISSSGLSTEDEAEIEKMLVPDCDDTILPIDAYAEIW